MTDTLRQLLTNIRLNPEDMTARLVAADYYQDELRDEVRAKYIRYAVELVQNQQALANMELPAKDRFELEKRGRILHSNVRKIEKIKLATWEFDDTRCDHDVSLFESEVKPEQHLSVHEIVGRYLFCPICGNTQTLSNIDELREEPSGELMEVAGRSRMTYMTHKKATFEWKAGFIDGFILPAVEDFFDDYQIDNPTKWAILLVRALPTVRWVCYKSLKHYPYGVRSDSRSVMTWCSIIRERLAYLENIKDARERAKQEQEAATEEATTE